MRSVARRARTLSGAFSFAVIGSVLPAAAVEPGLSVEFGREELRIPDMRFGIVKFNFNGGGTTIRTLENSNGEFDGVRLDLAIGSTPFSLGGKPMVLGVKGFHSWLGTGRDTQDFA